MVIGSYDHGLIGYILMLQDDSFVADLLVIWIKSVRNSPQKKYQNTHYVFKYHISDAGGWGVENL